MSNKETGAGVQSVDRAISVLEILARQGEAGVSEVAAEIDVHKSTAFRLLNALETRGLAERRQAARDRRSYALYLTSEGATLMRKLRPVLKAHESRMIAKVGADGREALLALLHEVADGKPARERRNGVKARSLGA